MSRRKSRANVPARLPQTPEELAPRRSAADRTVQTTTISIMASGIVAALPVWQQYVGDAAERILKLAENQDAHRLRLEEKTISEGLAAQRRGQFLATGLAALGILCGTYLLATGKSLAGFSVYLAAVGSLIVVAVWNQRSQRDERKERRDELAQARQRRG